MAVLLLETDPHRGLSSEDATDRLARFGPNTLPAAKGAGLPIASCASSTTC
jgi:cation-transporting P-type ATPase F